MKEEIDRLTSELQKLTEANNHSVASFRNLLAIEAERYQNKVIAHEQQLKQTKSLEAIIDRLN